MEQENKSLLSTIRQKNEKIEQVNKELHAMAERQKNYEELII